MSVLLLKRRKATDIEFEKGDQTQSTSKLDQMEGGGKRKKKKSPFLLS